MKTQFKNLKMAVIQMKLISLYFQETLNSIPTLFSSNKNPPHVEFNHSFIFQYFQQTPLMKFEFCISIITYKFNVNFDREPYG